MLSRVSGDGHNHHTLPVVISRVNLLKHKVELVEVKEVAHQRLELCKQTLELSHQLARATFLFDISIAVAVLEGGLLVGSHQCTAVVKNRIITLHPAVAVMLVSSSLVTPTG